MKYRIELSKRAGRLLKKLPADARTRIVRRIDELADNPRPRGTEKLKGEDDAYRIRLGDFRILYEVRDRVLLVLVLRVGHRREVYKRK